MIDSCNKNNVQSDYPIDYQKLDRMVKRIFTIKRLWGIPLTTKLYPKLVKKYYQSMNIFNSYLNRCYL